MTYIWNSSRCFYSLIKVMRLHPQKAGKLPSVGYLLVVCNFLTPREWGHRQSLNRFWYRYISLNKSILHQGFHKWREGKPGTILSARFKEGGQLSTFQRILRYRKNPPCPQCGVCKAAFSAQSARNNISRPLAKHCMDTR